MKKILALMLAGIMVLSMAACAKTQNPITEEITETQEGEAQKNTGLANPMVEITDSAEFEKQLGIRIDTSMLSDVTGMFIISGDLADVRMEKLNVNAEPVLYTLRATKDADQKDGFQGIQGELKEIAAIDRELGSGKTITILEREAADNADGQPVTVCTWDLDGTYYSLVIEGMYSQMQFAEVMDSILFATGLEEMEAPIGLANPMREVDKADIMNELGLEFKVLEGAKDVKYFIINDITAEMDFTDENGIQYTARMQPTSEFTDISGLYYEWDSDMGCEVSYCDGEVKRHIGDEETIDLILWFDAAPGIMYSLSATGKDLDGFDIEAVAEHMFVPVQGDVDAPVCSDGEFTVGIRPENIVDEGNDQYKVMAQFYTLVVLTDDFVKSLKEGDIIPLTQYGLDSIPVDSLKRKTNESLEIDEAILIEYNDEIKGWTMRGPDDDMQEYVTDYRIITFNADTQYEDEMAKVVGGSLKNIREMTDSYGSVKATVTVNNGAASKAVIHYHP